MVASIGQANFALLIPATAVYFVGVWLRAARWRLLVAPFADIPTSRLFRVIVIGFAVNNLLPFRLGELVRTFLLRRSHSVPVAASLASILLERVLDVVALCALIVAASMVVPLGGWLVGVVSFAWIVVGGAIVGLLALLIIPRSWLRHVLDLAVRLAGRFHARLADLVRSFLSGVGAIETPRAMLAVAWLSIACWVAELGLYYVVMLALSFDSGLPSLVVGMVVANLATVLPSSPGYVGTFDVPLQAVLTDAFGVPAALAGSYTLLAHVLLLAPVVVLGLLLLGRENLSLRALGRGRLELRSARGAPNPAARSLPD
jgi:uncharacterized protein (TIRG00374 family)